MILGDSPHAAQYVMFAIYWDHIAVKQRRKHFTHQHWDIHVIHLPVFPHYCFWYECSHPKGGYNMVKKQTIFFSFCSSVTRSISLSLWEKGLKQLHKGFGKAKSWKVFSHLLPNNSLQTPASLGDAAQRKQLPQFIHRSSIWALTVAKQNIGKHGQTRANAHDCLCVHRQIGTTGTNTSSRIVGADSGEHSRLKAEAGWAAHPRSQTVLIVQLLLIFLCVITLFFQTYIIVLVAFFNPQFRLIDKSIY